MTLVKRLTKGSELTYAEGDGNLDHFDAEINELQGAQVVSGSGTGMVFSRTGSVHFPLVGDGVTDCASLTTDYWTSLQGSGKILKYEAGEYLNSAVYPSLTGFYLELDGKDTILTSTRKSGGQILISGDGAVGIEGGIIQNRFGRMYDITAASVVGNVCTCTCPGHPYSIGDPIRVHAMAGLDNGNPGAPESPNGDHAVTAVVPGVSFSFATATIPNGSATIPYERPDLYNNGSRAIVPFVSFQRSSDDTCNIIQVFGGAPTWHVREATLRGTRQNCLQMYRGNGHVHNVHATEGSSDGFGMIGSPSNIRFTGLTKVTRVEEANMSMIGMRKMGGFPSNISVQLLDVSDQYGHGTGLDLVGVRGFHCDRFIATNMYHAGIRILGESAPYYDWGTRDISFGHITLSHCGAQASVLPLGWEDDDAVSFQYGATMRDEQDVENVNIDHLEIINSRWRPFGYSFDKPASINIGTLHVYGGHNGPSVLSLIRDWHVGRAVFEETPETALSMGDSSSDGRNVFDEIELANINNGAPKELDAASCNGTTVTFTTGSAHGLSSSTATFRVLGVESATTGSASQTVVEDQHKDFALNGNWLPRPSAWVASTNYAKWARVMPTTGKGGGFYFECVQDAGSAGTTEPTWPTVDGETVTDNAVVWVAREMVPVPWVASTAYALGARVVPTTGSAMNYYEATVAGTAGSTQPTWPNSGTVVDGGVTWTRRDLGNIKRNNTYGAITYPDTVTIAMTGTGKIATSSPRCYSTNTRIPRAYISRGGTASNDAIGLDISGTGAPQGSFIFGRVRLVDQFFPLDWLIQCGTTGAGRIGVAEDLTLRSTGLTGISIEGGGVPGFNRFISSAHVGTAFPAAVSGNTIYITRVWVDRPETAITKLGFRATTTESSKLARMGLYSAEGKILAQAEISNAFNITGEKEFNIYHRINRIGWYFLALITNTASTAAISWHYIDTSIENRIRSGALTSFADMGWATQEIAARLAAVEAAITGAGVAGTAEADLTAVKTALATFSSRAPAPDFQLTQAQAYGALPTTLTPARVTSIVEPHLWLRST
jgi:hypothetical protein